MEPQQDRGRGQPSPADAGRQGTGQGAIARLGEVDGCKVAHDEPDVRGWHVLTHDSCRLGEVADLIVDVEAMAVRYIDVELDRDALRLPATRRILVPPDAVLLNDDEEIVRLAATAAEISATPAYDPRVFSRADHQVLLRRYGRRLTSVHAVTPSAGRHRMSGRIELADGRADSSS